MYGRRPLLQLRRKDRGMSQARICDKCEKILVCNPSAKIEVDFGYYGNEHFELCEDCKKILVRWLTERKTNGT